MVNEIGCRQWIHPAPRAVFLFVHGLGAHTGRWESVGDYLEKRGYSSYAVELDGFDSYYPDIIRMRDRIARENPGKKIFLVGESLGGLISFLLAIGRPALFDGLICLSPAFANRLRLPPADYVKIFFALFYNKKKNFKVPFNSAMCTRDIDYRVKMETDKREARVASAILLTKLLYSQIRARLVKGLLRVPVIFFIAGDDKIVDTAITKKVFRGMKVKDKTLIEYPGMYHSLSIDLGREQVFAGIVQWVEKHDGARGGAA